ncbi:WXG100 family type VII secretion target [Planctomycetales bacterium 10988]|nr:WXG100 family type VII secretion target [Planctomycetales bacterium 10988]
MAQANVDPHELRRFARQLKKFTQELEGQMGLLNSQMNNLAASWRDQEQAKFSAEFDETIKQIARFTNAANQHIPFLLRKAERAEEYLNQR